MSRRSDNNLRLLIAVEDGRYDDIAERILLQEDGVDVNVRSTATFDCMTPLHTACRKGYLEIVDLLLSHNADIHVRDARGCTPLHYASTSGHFNVAQHLIHRNNAIVNSKNGQGVTPLHDACRSKQKEIVQLLLNSNADVNSKDIWGIPPLHYVGDWVDRIETEILHLLIMKDANVNSRNKIGETRLHIASELGQLDIVQLLLGKGACINIRTKKHNNTAEELAVQSNHKSIANYLYQFRLIRRQQAYRWFKRTRRRRFRMIVQKKGKKKKEVRKIGTNDTNKQTNEKNK